MKKYIEPIEFNTFWTLLRHLSGEDNLILEVIWDNCRWSSNNSTDEKLLEMYKLNGLNCQINVSKGP